MSIKWKKNSSYFLPFHSHFILIVYNYNDSVGKPPVSQMHLYQYADSVGKAPEEIRRCCAGTLLIISQLGIDNWFMVNYTQCLAYT